MPVLYHSIEVAVSFFNKQLRLWAEPAFCGIWSGSKLFVYVRFMRRKNIFQLSTMLFYGVIMPSVNSRYLKVKFIPNYWCLKVNFLLKIVKLENLSKQQFLQLRIILRYLFEILWADCTKTFYRESTADRKKKQTDYQTLKVCSCKLAIFSVFYVLYQ